MTTTFTEDTLLYRQALGFFWNDVFQDEDFINGYIKSFLIEFRGLQDYLDTLPDYLSRYLIPPTLNSDLRIFSFSTEDLDTTAVQYGDEGYTYDGSFGYGDIQPIPAEYRYPIGDFDMEFLSTGLDDGTILQKGRDFDISDGIITFYQDPSQLDGVYKRANPQEDGEMYIVSYLWGFEVEEDIDALCNYYGIFAGVCGDGTDMTKLAINIAWNMRVDGCSVQNLVQAMSLICGVDAVTEDGTVAEIFTEGSKTCIVTENAVYSASTDFYATVGPGDTVTPGTIIWDAFTVTTPSDPMDSSDFEAIVLNSGDVAGIKHGILLVNQQVDIEHSLPPGYQTIKVADDYFLVLDANRKIVGSVADEDEAADLILDNGTNYYTFFVGGSQSDVDSFMAKLNDGEENFFTWLEEDEGHLPISINPLQKFRALVFRDNAVFIRIKASLSDQHIAAQLLSVVYGTYSAGEKIFVILENEITEDEYSLAQASEEVTVFYAIEPEDTFDNVRDHVIAESVV